MKLAVLLNIFAVLSLLYVGAIGIALCIGAISACSFIISEGEYA